ncbi:SIT4 protein phosphatase-associated protein [Scheffersomyces stipitis CBS 6054]|uniref:SIT4 protein phosphatase-associated protein n=1 Tax=Scheffersomyces stipitis (strain ATCC 58785 / CBS 6054 / NBRC 10063 / NRRL Y-11545) TaxID=322104 RepID=A3M034_PICST|nr:SIT4 protein phosphatase-associated protein [Scheffersomyces stipitis CBS 6054]ABN68643.2 SIT4 protein phosphatase-associated protein [Scheffersomyces stipitis CBS 6054]
MSFWPFSNSLNSNSQLQKYLDSVVDFSVTSVQELLQDADLQQEVLNELHNIKGSYNNGTGFQFQTQQADNSSGSNAASADVVSLASSNNENAVGNTKDARGAKLLEILLQPHVLDGLLEYLVESVEFFYDQSIKEQESLDKLVSEMTDAETASDKIEVEQAEDTDAIDKDDDHESDSGTESEDDKFRRCVQASSDILSIDMWIMSNRIIETPNIMNKLWSLLALPHLEESSPTVSYLVHILDQLMDTNSIELLNFIRRQPDLVDTFLSKIDIPMLMDFFLRVIQTDRADSPTGILETLSSQKLVSKLIEILKPEDSQFVTVFKIPNHRLFFRQTAAADFIKALVTISSNTALAVVLETNIGPNPLTRELVSPKVINTMIHDIMLYQAEVDGKKQTNRHGINNCVGIIIELIRKNNSDYDLNCGSYSSLLQNGENGTGEINSFVMFQWLKDFEQNPPGPRDPIYLGEMLSIFSDNLEKFTALMDLAPVSPNGVETDVLGFTRFKISELIAELLHCSNMILLNSKKIRKIIKIRDYIRQQQTSRLKSALNETIAFSGSEGTSLHDVTMGLDDVSLDDIHFETDSETPKGEHDYRKLIESVEDVNDSEDEEPSISPENPFVCKDRDEHIRSNPCVGDYFKIKLIDSGILLNIISKFTLFPWHNFFHNVVFDLIQQIFNGKLNSYNSFLIVELFNSEKCALAELIVKSYRQNDVEPRPGYMGHLILISEEVVKFTSLYKPDLISPIIVKAISSENWDWFVEEILLKTREVYNVVLGAESEDIDTSRTEAQDQDFAYDSSAVGYLDLDSKKLIILGDKSNHDLFVSDKSALEDEDDDMGDSNIPEVRVQNMTPSGNMDSQAVDDDFETEEFQDTYQDNDFLDNLSGSSSSDDEDEESNELRRVPKHNE